jgi:hypothetical protein
MVEKASPLRIPEIRRVQFIADINIVIVYIAIDDSWILRLSRGMLIF